MTGEPRPAESLTEPAPEPPPPIGGTWKRLYTILILYLALLIIIFYGFTKAFE